MPMKLTTTIGKVQTIPNPKNIEIVNDFLDYMRKNGSSEHHQNNNLKIVLAFSTFLGKDPNGFESHSHFIETIPNPKNKYKSSLV